MAIRTLLGKDKYGDPRLLITDGGDPLDPLNPSVLFDSETSSIRVVQRGYVALDQTFTVSTSPAGVNVTRTYKTVLFPAQTTVPMVVCALHRPTSGVWWTRMAQPDSTGDDLLRGDWLIGPSICRQLVIYPTGGIRRYRVAYYFSVRAQVFPDEEDPTAQALTIACYSPLGGDPNDLYYASYMILNVG